MEEAVEEVEALHKKLSAWQRSLQKQEERLEASKTAFSREKSQFKLELRAFAHDLVENHAPNIDVGKLEEQIVGLAQCVENLQGVVARLRRKNRQLHAEVMRNRQKEREKWRIRRNGDLAYTMGHLIRNENHRNPLYIPKSTPAKPPAIGGTRESLVSRFLPPRTRPSTPPPPPSPPRIPSSTQKTPKKTSDVHEYLQKKIPPPVRPYPPPRVLEPSQTSPRVPRSKRLKRKSPKKTTRRI